MPQQSQSEPVVEEKTLSAFELLTQVLAVLVEQLGGKEIVLPHPAFAEIADDSDWHRKRKGYSQYKEAFLVCSGSKKWVLSLGQACGGYPAGPYNCDIAAIPLTLQDGDDEISAKSFALLEANEYFENCLVAALDYGGLFWIEKYKAIVGPSLQAGMNDFIAKESENNHEVFHMDFRPVRSPVRYKPEAIPFLVETLKSALATLA